MSYSNTCACGGLQAKIQYSMAPGAPRPSNTALRDTSSWMRAQYSALLARPFPRAEWGTPSEFDGRKVWAKYLSAVKDEESCSSCYAFAAAGALADHYNIRTLGAPKIELSGARLVICHSSAQCGGGSLVDAWMGLFLQGTNTTNCFDKKTADGANIFPIGAPEAPVPSCNSMAGKCHDECYNGAPAVFYKARYIYAVPGTAEFGGDESEIRAQIYRFGPITSAFQIYMDFFSTSPSTVYKWDGISPPVAGHAIVIDGWGIDAGQPFWWVRNSWGPYWGDEGYFKIARGTNECKIEENAVMGIARNVAAGDIAVLARYVPPDFLEKYQPVAAPQNTFHLPACSQTIDPVTSITRRALADVQDAALRYGVDTSFSRVAAGQFLGKVSANQAHIAAAFLLLFALAAVLLIVGTR